MLLSAAPGQTHSTWVNSEEGDSDEFFGLWCEESCCVSALALRGPSSVPAVAAPLGPHSRSLSAPLEAAGPAQGKRLMEEAT